ncbi:hypothetical protein C0993_003473 [Termitomyces sp. T159_Od127]|nr:hypothetical protein C0993_003473 [Termitomyces sp. T159_Od127]
MQENNLKQFEHRLLHHLSKDTKLFQQIQGTIKARAELWEWFGLLDEIVGLLFCLSSTTWGGGARGTECDDLKYANNRDGGRHMFIINNTLTFIATYTKSRNIHGVTRQVAHSPSFRVSRMLLLLLSSVYPAAAHMAVMCLMPKEHAENYLTHVFVQSGQIMKTDNFSKALSSFTKHMLNRPMGMRDWRQVMCSIMLNIGRIDFHLPDDDDEDLKMVHGLFNHSVKTGEQHYALQINDALPGFSHTSIASDQREIKGAIIDQDEKSQQDSFSQLDTCLRPMLDSLKVQLQQDYNEMQNKMISRLEEYMQLMAPYIAQEVIHAFGLTSAPQPQPPQHVIQAELVQTCLSDKHVIAVLPTGTGKTLSFFSAAILHPKSMFLVIIPLTSLVEDMQHRLNRTNIQGSIYPQSDAIVDRIVLVPYHLVTTDKFREWASAAHRIKRIFMDECHHIYTSQFRQVFHLLKVLTSLGKPITFLSATIFPRSIDLLCDWMEIPRSIVHEIRSATPSRNIEFTVEHISDTKILEDRLVRHVQGIQLQLHERGLIYCRTKAQVERIAIKLGFPFYHSSLDNNEVANNMLKKQRQFEWRNAMEPTKQWMNSFSLVTMNPPSFSLPILKGSRKRSAHDAALSSDDQSLDTGRASMMQPLNVTSGSQNNWDSPAAFDKWMNKAPKDHTEVPRHVQFIIAYYRKYKELDDVSQMQVDE